MYHEGVNDAKISFLYDLFKRITNDLDFNAYTNRTINCVFIGNFEPHRNH